MPIHFGASGEPYSDDEDKSFTREDVKDALKALKADNKLLSTMASREWIEKQTKVVIPPNKRNGRKQATHLKSHVLPLKQ